jgi:hypothetical protein
MSMRFLLLHSFKAILLASVLIALTPGIGRAQSVGTFLPSVYSDAATQPIPLRVQTPAGMPVLNSQAFGLKQRLDDAHRPYISNIFAFSTQPLNDINYKYNSYSEGVEAGFYPNLQTKIQFDYIPTVFTGGQKTVIGTEYSTKITAQPTDRLKYFAKIGLYETGQDVRSGSAVIGGTGATYAINDRLSMSAGFSREVVGNSILSAVGQNLPGTRELVGRVKSNAFSIGPNIRLTRKTELNLRYVGGVYTGDNVKTNPFQEVNLRIAHTLIGREEGARVQFLQPSLQLLVTGFRYDESGFGNLTFVQPSSLQAAVTQLQQSRAGIVNNLTPGQSGPMVGGYFSPSIFFLALPRMDVGGRAFGNTFYKAGIGLGPQAFKSESFGSPSLLATANVSFSSRLSKHVTMEQGYYFLQAGNVYTRHIVYNQLAYHF